MVRTAFLAVPYPGDEHIVHCEYDRRWGGTLDGPCRECAEIVDYFRARATKGHHAGQLSFLRHALKPFTPAAFCYWLPTFINSALSKSEYAGNIKESIEFRFESSESIQWQDQHIGALTKQQLRAIESYFEFQLDQPSEHKPFVEDCLRTISRYNSMESENT
jgi:hypothetical protein